MQYRESHPDQIQQIVELFKKTFTDSEGPQEGKIISGLARDLLGVPAPEDRLVFVAMEGELLVGCIIFTRFTSPDQRKAFLMAPVAVHTDYQGRGIGQALIRYGHQILQQSGVTLVLTYGDINFYGKVGYQVIEEKLIPAPQPLSYPQGWMALSLDGEPIAPVHGPTDCVAPLKDPAYW